MNLSIGAKIKQLRRDNDVTQEKLADYLNISYQAISKWENGSALPDITMVIPIANFFGVSTDELFDMDSQKESDEIKEYEEKRQYYKHNGLVNETLALCRNMVAKYPKNYQLLLNLAYALRNVHDEREAAQREIIIICERILSDCTIDDIRQSSVQLISLAYTELEDEDNAVKYACMAGSMYVSRQMLLERTYIDKDKKLKQSQHNILQFLDFMDMSISHVKYSISRSHEEKIFMCETALKLWNAIFYDGNFLFYHTRVAEIYRALANSYARLQNRNKVMENLYLSKKHALAFDSIYNVDGNYTGVFLDRLTYDSSQSSKNNERTDIDGLKEDILSNNWFDFIRDDSEFIEFIRSL